MPPGFGDKTLYVSPLRPWNLFAGDRFLILTGPSEASWNEFVHRTQSFRFCS
jgi:hypothetical protein